MNGTIVNPLNLYGPMIPVSFEAMQPSSGASKEEIQEQIDKSIENAAFILEEE